MRQIPLPSDASSLLVPVHLDAWVVDSQNQEGLAWYYADYDKLRQFRSPIPDAFDISDASKPEVGVHLHWALPDALTHGRAQSGSERIEFPYVPNRWFIARFNTPTNGPWQCRLWVVHSDFLSKSGTSAFIDPWQTTSMQVTPGGRTTFNVQSVGLGKSYTIEAWEAQAQADGGQPFLRAVGPGNVSFAAYAPFVKDVFSFTDQDLPHEGTGTYRYTYQVIGWYSDPQAADPLRGVATYDPRVWKTRDDWQSQNPRQRFQTLLTRLQWSVQGEGSSSPPATSLYHGLVVGVQWPYSTLGNAGIDPNNVQVAVGHTAIDALAALIQAQAQKEAKDKPTETNAWQVAGNALAELIQAAVYDLLDDYTVPGGAALIRQQIEQTWFGSNQGGIVWNVVSAVPQAAVQSAVQPALTPAQLGAINQQLAALNQAQRALDQAQRHLASLQADFYMLWLKVARAGSFDWGESPTTVPAWSDLKAYMEQQIYPSLVDQVWDQLCAVRQAQGKLPDPIDNAAAMQWAKQNWTFPKSDPELSGTLSLQDLGLMLKASTMSHFWHPNDPVVLISGLQRSQKHGGDGRYNKDGTLTCRLPGQTITGLQISGQPTIDLPALRSKGVNLDPYGPYMTIPAVPTLIHEAFFADPANAPLIANAIGGTPQAISTAIENLLEQAPGSGSWIGTAPAPFAIRRWQQAWAPLFLEWVVNYYPTGTGEGSTRQFSLSDWQFDGQQYRWKGSGLDENYFVSYKARTLLTAQAPLVFKSKIQKYLANNPNIDSQQLDVLLDTVAGWDLLSQSLSGLMDQLITLMPQETFPPTPQEKPEPVQCPRPHSGGSLPDLAMLVGDQYHAMPMLEAGNENVNHCYPVRGGFLQFQQLRVVDAFGQTYAIKFEQGFEPLLSQNLTSTSPSVVPPGAMQLVPRVIQSTRLDFRFLANDGSGQDILLSNNSNAICGWLLPNHLDGGIAVYDAAGVLLGEVVPLPRPNNWRPRPGSPGANPAPQRPADIPNATLKAVVSSMAEQSVAVFEDVLTVIDETLWMVDPLGGRKDQFLSVLIGRPLAVVQVELQLNLLGDPAYNQTWNAMLPSQKPYRWLHNTGGVEDVAFPVRLGSLELRDDGVIGYFLQGGTSTNYATFYTLQYPDGMHSDNAYVRQIVRKSGSGTESEYQGDIHLKCNGESVPVTLILDPRGSVHAYTGILPVVSEALPPHLVEDFMKELKVTFQTGPIIADPGTLRTPKPAESHGTWTWLQPVAAPTIWEEDQIVDADDRARLPDEQLQLREGWLRLSDNAESDT